MYSLSLARIIVISQILFVMSFSNDKRLQTNQKKWNVFSSNKMEEKRQSTGGISNVEVVNICVIHLNYMMYLWATVKNIL